MLRSLEFTIPTDAFQMESLQKTIAETVDTESLIFLREETWKRRQVVYVCESGYELHRENCGIAFYFL